MSQQSTGFGTFFGHFAAAFGTILLVGITFAFLFDDDIKVSEAGFWSIIAICLIYAWARTPLQSPSQRFEPEYPGRGIPMRDAVHFIDDEGDARVEEVPLPEQVPTVESAIAEHPEREFDIALDLLEPVPTDVDRLSAR